MFTDTAVHCGGKKNTKFCYRVAISKPSCALRPLRMVNIFREAVFGTRLKMRMSLRATTTLPAGVMSTWKERLTFATPKLLTSWNSGVPKHGSFSTSFTGEQPVSTPRLNVEIQIIEYVDFPERKILPVFASAGLPFVQIDALNHPLLSPQMLNQNIDNGSRCPYPISLFSDTDPKYAKY